MVHLLKLMVDYNLMINEKNLQTAINEVIDNDDKVVVLYSGLWSFIDKLNFKLKSPDQIPKIILNMIEDKIGKNKTLFLPSFTGKIF